MTPAKDKGAGDGELQANEPPTLREQFLAKQAHDRDIIRKLEELRENPAKLTVLPDDTRLKPGALKRRTLRNNPRGRKAAAALKERREHLNREDSKARKRRERSSQKQNPPRRWIRRKRREGDPLRDPKNCTRCRKPIKGMHYFSPAGLPNQPPSTDTRHGHCLEDD